MVQTNQRQDQEYVILVDEQDKEIGIEEKLEAHRNGKLHRAFSLLVYDSDGNMLLQQRADTKYHSPKLWSEACCGHPLPNESINEGSHRKLKQEMGFDCELKALFKFVYRAELDNNMTEHEVDYVLTGVYNSKPKINPLEAKNYRFVRPVELKEDVKKNPQNYAIWFRLIINELDVRGLEEKVQ